MRTKYPLPGELKQGLNLNKAQEKKLFMTTNTLLSRAKLAERLGKSGWDSDKRNLYTSLGYVKYLVLNDFEARYTRQGIAKRVVDAPCDEVWYNRPVVSDGEKTGADEDGLFDKTWRALAKKYALFSVFNRADKLSGIGEYGVLVLGFDDIAEKLSDPVVRKEGMQLLYMQPYSQRSVEIDKYVTDPFDGRYGLPEIYEVRTSVPSSIAAVAGEDSKVIRDERIHWTRVIHMSDGLLENNIKGEPRMQAVFNHLQDLELISGGSAEMYWRAAFMGLAFQADKDADILTEDLADLEDEIDKYIHNLSRYIKVQGIDVKPLAPQVESPKEFAELQFKLISGATGIPVRVLTGSERGELASSQDESNWIKQISMRMINYAEPMVLRPFINRLIEFGVLPKPFEDEYSIEWPDLNRLNEKDAAEVADKKASAINVYASGQASMVLHPEMFLRHVMGLTEDEIMRNEELIAGIIEDEDSLKEELEE